MAALTPLAQEAVAQNGMPQWWVLPQGTVNEDGPYPCNNGAPTVRVPRMMGSSKLAVGQAHFVARAAACGWQLLDVYEWGASYVCARAVWPWGQPTGECVMPSPASVMELDRASKPDRCPLRTPNPILPLAGAKRTTVELGASLAGYPLTWTYNSASMVAPSRAGTPPLTSADRAEFGALGFGSFHRRLLFNPYSKSARVTRGNGDVVSFAPGPAESFVSEADSSDRLVRDGAGYRFVDSSASAIEVFDSDGRLRTIRRANGRAVSFTYSDSATPSSVAPAAGYLISATDDTGRTIRFSYELPVGGNSALDGRVKTIDLPQGQIGLSYAGASLGAITWPDGRVRRFLYEDVSLPRAMTGVLDEAGATYARIRYDSRGVAVSSALAGGVDDYTINYSRPPAVDIVETYDAAKGLVVRTRTLVPPTGTSIVRPNGSVAQVGAISLNGVNRLESQSQPAGSGCAASSSAQTYDANGNIASRDDFNGNRTCYAHDPGRNLETVRVEGLAGGAPCSVTAAAAALPAGSRKVSTQWHPQWALRTRVAEPGRVTTYVYNGQPDPFAGNAPAACAPTAAPLPDGTPIAVLCKQVEQATSDPDGSAGFAAAVDGSVAVRAQTWTYNADGQVLTHDGPRTDVADVTLYEYHAATSFTGTDPNAVGITRGDLKKVTRPNGSSVLYKLYDKLGQVLETEDANGVVSLSTYDARQRLTSVTVAGRRTDYEYGPTGLLRQITQPDGSWVRYGHDDAHRLVQVSDNLGNSVTYTLDNAGNRTGEQFKDPNGVLRRHLARSIDALGRVQQLTGRE